MDDANTCSTTSAGRLRQMAPREALGTDELSQLWRVESGALRIDSAPRGERARFVRLALPGDVIGVERWAGTDDSLALRALIASRLTPVHATGEPMMQILMETVVVGHQRCREVVSLRTGPVAKRIKALLLLFAQNPGESSPGSTVIECAVPHIADLSDIVDAAPETVSRVFGSMRDLDFLQDRRPQKACFSSQALRSLEMVAGMSAPRPHRPPLLSGA
jgi:CRP-like cAMP-binding protein